jgi:tetratricopeptide (TPR) repeat protein
MALPLLFTLNVHATQNCDIATDLVYKENTLHEQNASPAERKKLLQEAVKLCPNNEYAHNNLGNLLGEEEQFAQAIEHFKQAVKIKPTLKEAWNGLGEAYYEQKQYPLSLEAYLHICQEPDARKKVTALINAKRHQIVEPGQLLNKASLHLLFDPKKRAVLEKLIADCGFKAYLKPIIIFRNLIFKPGEAILETLSQEQVIEITQTLKDVQPKQVIVDSYTNDMELAKNRADTIKNELTKHEVPEDSIKANGYVEPTLEQVKIEAE